MKRLAFHEAAGVLNVGDLHPGGRAATEFLLRELDKISPGCVLEIGAGIGASTARMIRRGWRVVPIEPNKILRRKLEGRVGISALASDFETFESADGIFDVVIGESVFYGMDLRKAFEKVYRLLRPGGLLAFTDMVWTEAADPVRVIGLHEQTKRTFGIPVASRQALTWSDWKRLLRDTGFVVQTEQQVPPGSRGASEDAPRTTLTSAFRHPLAFAQHLTHRRHNRRIQIPPGWTENWMAVWQRI